MIITYVYVPPASIFALACKVNSLEALRAHQVHSQVCVIDLYCIIVQLITNHDENPLRTSKRVKQVSAGKLKPWAIRYPRRGGLPLMIILIKFRLNSEETVSG